MKKLYEKPIVRIENFISDIAFAGSCQDRVNQEKNNALEGWKLDDRGYSDFESYWQYLISSKDDLDSGICYFTVSYANFS